MESAIDRPPLRLTPLGVAGDARLVRLAARGDEAAFAQIFRRYHQPLYRYCRAITGNGEDAGDALQNTMVKAMRALPGERRSLELKPWLFRIAHNEAVSLLRGRRPQSVLQEAHGAAVQGPEAGLAGREDLRDLMCDLHDLPGRQQAAVILRELNGLSYAEIGEVFGTSTIAAKQAAYDGRSALQDYAKGRAMDCDAVTRAISDGDRGFLRGRKLRGHLRACRDCSDFKRAIESRSASLAAIAPALPATAAGALMGKLFGGGGGSAGGGALGMSAVGGNLAAGVGAVKGAALVAAVALGAGAAVGGVQLNGQPPGAAQPERVRSSEATVGGARGGGERGSRPGGQGLAGQDTRQAGRREAPGSDGAEPQLPAGSGPGAPASGGASAPAAGRPLDPAGGRGLPERPSAPGRAPVSRPEPPASRPGAPVSPTKPTISPTAPPVSVPQPPQPAAPAPEIVAPAPAPVSPRALEPQARLP